MQSVRPSCGCSATGVVARIGGFARRRVASSETRKICSGPVVRFMVVGIGSNGRTTRRTIRRDQKWRRLCVKAIAAAEESRNAGVQAELSQLDAAKLVQELREVFATGRTRSAEWRKEQLKGLARLMREREEEIGEALRRDLNKPFFETFLGEISRIRNEADEAAENVSTWMRTEKVPTTLATYPSTAAIIPEPLGATLIISTWNFPILLSLEPVLGALAAGNVVTLKPSELAPYTSALLAKFIPLYVDPTAVRVVEGGIGETTALLEHRWDKIFYTGSSRVGRIIMAAAAKHLTPVTLELGGKSPAIVDATADVTVAATRIALGKWAANNGQACIAPDYLLVEESVMPQMVKNLTDIIIQFYGEDPSTSTDISRVVNRNNFLRLAGLLDDKRTAEKVVFGAQRNESNLYISPTIILDPPIDSPIMQDEIFGPLLPIITVKNVGDAIKFVNLRPKPLALYLFTADKTVEEQVLQETSSGGVTVNDTILHVATRGLPFGGVGESGYGSYHGKYSFDNFSHKKAVLSRKLSGDDTIRRPPYKPKQLQVLRAITSGDLIGVIRALLGFK